MKKYLLAFIPIIIIVTFTIIYFLPFTQKKIKVWELTRKPWIEDFYSHNTKSSIYDSTWLYSNKSSPLTIDFNKLGFVTFYNRIAKDTMVFLWHLNDGFLKLQRFDTNLDFMITIDYNHLSLMPWDDNYYSKTNFEKFYSFKYNDTHLTDSSIYCVSRRSN